MLDADGRYQLVNDALAGLNGVSADEHLGRPPEEVVPELAPKLRAAFARILEGEPAVRLELDDEPPARPGRRSTLQAFYPLPDGEGNVAGIGTVVLDVTDRRDVERARDEAHALLDALFERAPVGLGFWDRDLRFRRVNGELAEMTGVAPEDHVGRTVAELLPGLSPALDDALRRALDHGALVTGEEVSGETPGLPGVRRHWSVSCYPVRDPSGAVVGVGAVCDEISDLRHARDSERYLTELLHEERSVLREVVGRAPAGIALLWGDDDRVRLANQRFREIAVLRDDPTGRTFAEILPDLWAIAEPLLRQVRETGRSIAREDFPIPARDAALEGAFEGNRYMSFTLDRVTTADGARGGILLVVMETTQQVRRRATLEAELREERHIAATLQRALLPRRLPEVPGAALAARYEAAGARFDVGGDFYDAVDIAEGEWMVVVGDVCGKGAEAAAFTAMARYTLRAEAGHASGPGPLLSLLSSEMLRHEASGAGELAPFATVACAWVRPEHDGLAVRVACAAQPDPLVLRADGTVDRLPPGGPPCGAFPDVEYPDHAIRLARDEALVLYTDGVLDAGAPQRPLRISELAERLAGRTGAQAIADAVAEAVAERGRGNPRDDYAVLVLAAA